MGQVIAIGTNDRMARDWVKESVSEIAASMASRLSKSREAGGAVLADPQIIEDNCAYHGITPDTSGLANPIAVRMSQEQRTTKPNADEYRGRVDACLTWAREAPTDEVRLACLTLAQAWLRAAMRQGGEISDHLPLAPTL
jgi:phage-related protein